MRHWLVLLGIVLLIAAVSSDGGSSARQRNRAYSALPNWSGLWEVVGVTPNASNIVESYREIRARFYAHPPYNRDWEARFQAASRQDQVGADQPSCTWGFPMLMLESPLMFEVLITPEETAMVFSGREIRHIYTDGRDHLARDEIFPTHWGDSIGHWEDKTLVIDTVAVDSPAIFIWASEGGELVGIFSSAVRYHERVKLIGQDLLEDELTISDPVALTRPWVLRHRYHRVTSIDRMIHEDCEGNDRNPVVNGHFTMKAP